MSKVKIELDKAGMRELLRSQEIMETLREPAESVRAQLGDKFQTESYTGKGRVNISVYTTDPAAIRDNERNNTILKGMGIKPKSGRKKGKKS